MKQLKLIQSRTKFLVKAPVMTRRRWESGTYLYAEKACENSQVICVFGLGLFSLTIKMAYTACSSSVHELIYGTN